MFLLIALTIAMLPGLVHSEGEIKGYMVGEYYFVLDHNTGEYGDGGGKGRNGFWFRRIYFTYDNKLSDSVKMRFRLETASPAQWSTSSLLVPFVKDAYLSFKLGQSSLIGGIMSPPSFAQIEDIWGYRTLEKTPLDLYRWTSSRDFGISFKGGQNFIYHFMFANGSSNKAEINLGKKIYGSLGYKFGGFFVEAMAQYDRAKEGDNDLIFQTFGAYSGDWGRIGIQFSNRSYTPKNLDSRPYNVFSVFAVIKADENLELIGRYDMNFGNGYKESFSGDKIAFVPFAENHEFSFIIAALSWQVVKNVWLIPNMKFATYKENEDMKNVEGYEKPESDAYANFTVWFKF